MVDTGFIVPEPVTLRKRRNRLADFFIRLVRTKPLGTVSGVVVVVFFFTGMFSGIVAPYGFNEQFRQDVREPPSSEHWLGTDNLGRDMLSRIIFGARVSMLVGVLGSLISITVSVLIGLPSGYFGGKFDLVVQRFIDAWIVFPDIIILILLVTILGPGVWKIVFILGISSGLGGSRTVRGQTIGIRQNVYVEAAQATGASTGRILLRHILPNIAAYQIVSTSTRMPGLMLAEAGLSFLGLGVPPPMPSWGGMLSGSAISHVQVAPWMALWPGLALSLVIYSTNMFGDALRDLLDPKLRGAMGRYGRDG